MKIGIVGTGYVGLITGVGLAKNGFDVVCVDVDQKKVDTINAKKPPIFEEGLQELMNELVPSKLKATTDLKAAVLASNIVFICVGTPCDDSGKIDLKFIRAVSQEIGKALKEKKEYSVVVVKSTVVPGTTGEVVGPILEKESGKRIGKDFGLAMTPEFLREGKAVEDVFSPDRIVIGAVDDKSRSLVKSLYSSYSCPVVETDLKTAEMIKYASNSFLATKISFVNEMGNLCKKLGIDMNDVAKGMGLDSRIGPKFLQSGCGFGGSCFGKDVSAILNKGREAGEQMTLLNAALEVNRKQPLKMVELMEKRLGSLKGKKIAVLGLAFKEGTDDVRDSPAIPIIRELEKRGALVSAFDSEAKETIKKPLPGLRLASSAQVAVDGADGVLLVTPWKEFETLDYGAKPVVDGKNVLPKEARKAAKGYEGICW